jgi:translocation and assembly module TamB
MVAQRIGKRLGLDEAGVEENELIGGTALTVGQYLSPRLYLSYGVGLFEPGEVVGLRYKLTKYVGVRIQRGTEETRTGVEYRIER